MKRKVKEYAAALAGALADQKADGKKIAQNFFKLLEKNGDMGKARAIVEMAERYMIKKNGGRKVVMETAREIATASLLKNFAGKDDMVVQKINPALVAGVKIVVDGQKQLDFSLKRKLQELFQ